MIVLTPPWRVTRTAIALNKLQATIYPYTGVFTFPLLVLFVHLYFTTPYFISLHYPALTRPDLTSRPLFRLFYSLSVVPPSFPSVN